MGAGATLNYVPFYIICFLTFSCFLRQQGIPDLHCISSALDVGSTSSPYSFNREWYLETKNWLQEVVIANEMLLLLGFFSGQTEKTCFLKSHQFIQTTSTHISVSQRCSLPSPILFVSLFSQSKNPAFQHYQHLYSSALSCSILQMVLHQYCNSSVNFRISLQLFLSSEYISLRICTQSIVPECYLNSFFFFNVHTVRIICFIQFDGLLFSFFLKSRSHFSPIYYIRTDPL